MLADHKLKYTTFFRPWPGLEIDILRLPVLLRLSLAVSRELILKHGRRQILWLGVTAHSGSSRRDHAVVFGQRYLRHMLLLYMQYYNGTRTHLSLNKDAPVPRPIQTVGRILASLMLGGLHHQYFRI